MGTLAPEAAAQRTAPTRVPFADCFITPEAQTAALDVLRCGWVTTGKQAHAFESEFAERVGSPHAVAVSSCTVGIELALRTLGLKPGSRVLVSSVTFCGAVHAIVHAGFRPVLVDVDPETSMPDELTTRRAAEASGGVEAMLVVHLAGDLADVPSLAAAAGLPVDKVVEDAAHAIGTFTATAAGGRPIGSGSAATCFSFYATKNLPIGEGGMVTTDDPDRAELIRRVRLHGMTQDAWRRYLPGGSWRYDVSEVGLKANMTDLQAAIGRAQPSQLDTWQRRRHEIAARYDARLGSLPGVRIPHRPAPGEGIHAWHLYPIRVSADWGGGRDRVAAMLEARSVSTSVHFIPIHRLTYFRQFTDTPQNQLNGADALFPTLLSLPMYPRLRDEQVDAVCDALIAVNERTLIEEV